MFIDGVPAWGSFAPDGLRVLVTSSNLPDRWLLTLGRFTGVGPDTGKAYDLDAAAVSRLAEEAGAGPVDAEIAGHAWDVDRWLWGRGDDDQVEISGSPEAVRRVRALAAEATQ